MPDRFNVLMAYDAVLDGRQYDTLEHSFDVEKTGNGEYVPLSKRRPSVRTGLCRTVVDDSVSLLFSEGHWPGIKATQKATTDALGTLVKEAKFNLIMLAAATRGSIGSVAIHVQFLEGRCHPKVMQTAALTPTWQKLAPDKLETVTERRLVMGKDLVTGGYVIPNEQLSAVFWFQRKWDEQSETWFVPIPFTATGDAAIQRLDPDRTVKHGLGFVPLIWIKNLPSMDGGPDGECTFKVAIDTVIEADYLMSQAGRGLRYASDPTLVIKQGASFDDGPARIGGAASGLSVPPDGDAKLLEINGSAASTVLDHVQALRAIALETMHGNRAHADRLSAATSGRSIELMMTGLIWLADRLRISYGEGAVLDFLRMVCAASSVLETGVMVGGVSYRDLDPDGLELAWAPWMPPMPQDALVTAQALVTAKEGGIVSQETATARYAALLNVDDASAELAKVQKEEAEKAAADEAVAVRAAANAGSKETLQITA